MGAWGYKPEKNDHAGDWIIAALRHRTKSLTDLIEETLQSPLEKSVVEFEIRAAALLLERLGDVYPYRSRRKHVPLAISKLEEMLRNGWADSWEKPKRMRKELQRQISALRQWLPDHSPCTASYLALYGRESRGQPASSTAS